MKKIPILILATLFFAQLAPGGSISGTVTNATGVDGFVLVVAMLHAGVTDLTSAPMEYVMMPEFPQEYTVTNDAIVDMNPYFPVAYMPEGFLPTSGDPFGARLLPPVLTWGGVATDVDLTLFSSGNIGGNIDYSGSYAKVCVNVYDYYSIMNPTLESTHFIGDDNYHLTVIPSGPKRVQAFDDLNGNMVFDDGEPNGYYSIPFIGLDIVLVTGNVSNSGINITIEASGIDEAETPSALALQAYPNPFNSSVTITVSDEATSPLQIEVFDINGRKIAELTPPAPLNRGEQEKSPLSRGYLGGGVWQPDKSFGSGVYFVRARSGDESVSKRVVYLK